MDETWQPGPDLQRVANLDHERGARRGYPDAALCEPKTPEQVRLIAAGIKDAGTPTLSTRASSEHAQAVLAMLPDANHVPEAHMIAWPAEAPAPCGGPVVVLG